MHLHRSEVLIIGGGISGIATALDLLDGGKSVMLFDRDEAGAFGGLARESFGGMFFVDSPEQRRLGIRDSADLALATGTASLSSARKISGPGRGRKPMCSAARRTSIAGCAAMASAFSRLSTGSSAANSVPAIPCRVST